MEKKNENLNNRFGNIVIDVLAWIIAAGIKIFVICLIVFGLKCVIDIISINKKCSDYYSYVTSDDEIGYANQCKMMSGNLYCYDDDYIIKVKEIQKVNTCD